MAEKPKDELSEAEIKLQLEQVAEAENSLPDDDAGVRTGFRWALGCGAFALLPAVILLILVPAKWLMILCGIPICAGLGFRLGIIVTARGMMGR